VRTNILREDASFHKHQFAPVSLRKTQIAPTVSELSIVGSNCDNDGETLHNRDSARALQ